MAKHYTEFSVLQIDAHADLFDEYEGAKYSHACVMRRCRELCDCTQLGIRAVDAEEQEFISKEKPKNIFMGSDLSKEKISQIVGSLKKNVYVTFDLDAFNPELVPEVGNPVPGGLGWESTLSLLEKVFSERNVAGFDVVELSPVYMSSNSAVVASELAIKMMEFTLKGKKKMD
jgi:agmatinase